MRLSYFDGGSSDLSAAELRHKLDGHAAVLPADAAPGPGMADRNTRRIYEWFDACVASCQTTASAAAAAAAGGPRTATGSSSGVVA